MNSLKVVQFLAVVLTAFALVPAGAHLFELPNKIGLSQEHYFIVQGIYRGWALFGFVLFGALAANLALTVMLRDRRGPFRLALLTSILIAGTLVIFFAWTYRRTRRRATGRSPPTTGASCGRNGNIRTLSTPC